MQQQKHQQHNKPIAKLRQKQQQNDQFAMIGNNISTKLPQLMAGGIGVWVYIEQTLGNRHTTYTNIQQNHVWAAVFLG